MSKTKLGNSPSVIGIILFLTITLTPAIAWCGQVGMAWDTSVGSAIEGYRVFCRNEDALYDYARPSWESTDTRCVITDLDDDKTYYAVVRAYNSDGVESSDSNEVSFQPCQSYPLLSENYFYDVVKEGDPLILDYIDTLEKDFTIAGYNWAQAEGRPVVLSDPSEASPTFTAPPPLEDSEEYRFVVGIKTTDGLCDAAEVAIVVEKEVYRSAATEGGGSSGGCFILACLSKFDLFLRK